MLHIYSWVDRGTADHSHWVVLKKKELFSVSFTLLLNVLACKWPTSFPHTIYWPKITMWLYPDTKIPGNATLHMLGRQSTRKYLINILMLMPCIFFVRSYFYFWEKQKICWKLWLHCSDSMSALDTEFLNYK